MITTIHTEFKGIVPVALCNDCILKYARAKEEQSVSTMSGFIIGGIALVIGVLLLLLADEMLMKVIGGIVLAAGLIAGIAIVVKARKDQALVNGLSDQELIKNLKEEAMIDSTIGRGQDDAVIPIEKF